MKDKTSYQILCRLIGEEAAEQLALRCRCYYYVRKNDEEKEFLARIVGKLEAERIHLYFDGTRIQMPTEETLVRLRRLRFRDLGVRNLWENGMTQEQIAEKLHLSISTIQRIINKKTKR